MTFVLLSPPLTNNLFFFKTPKLKQKGVMREGKNPKNGYLNAMTVPLRSLNKNYTKDVLASSTSTILLHPFPENKYQNHVLDAI